MQLFGGIGVAHPSNLNSDFVFLGWVFKCSYGQGHNLTVFVLTVVDKFQGDDSL